MGSEATDSAGKPRGLGIGPAVMLAAGVLLAMTGAWTASHFQLGSRLLLDLKGETAPGFAQQKEDGAYRIRYTHPSGSIHARSNFSGLGIQRIKREEGAVLVKYDPEDPAHMQPAGCSALPATAAFLLFLPGMTLALRARRGLIRQARARAEQARAESRSGKQA